MRSNLPNDITGRLTACLLALFCAGPVLAAAHGAGVARAAQGACSYTAQVARTACGHDTEDNYFIALGKCANLDDASARALCKRLAGAVRAAGPAECAAQFESRDDLCDELGQAPYDPDIDPAQFVDPRAIGDSVAPNPYFSLVPGSTWVLQGGGETVSVEVTGETAEILGVTVAVVRDVVSLNGEVIEDTIDWYAQDLLGNVWYFGEISQNLEGGVLKDIDGSWTAGESLARPGFAFKAAPQVGDLYRQEFLLGDAEDIARVLSATASATSPAASCNATCVLNEEFTPITPDAIEHKYYAPGVGFILETDPATGERLLELVSYHIGAR